MLDAQKAKQRLIEGNETYVDSGRHSGDVGAEARLKTAQEGQHPYAIIVACSDAREIPEIIFNAGIGDLFVIRVAGNVIDPHQLGSIEYAVDHLGCKLVVVLGHTHCGAVHAAIHHDPDGHIKYITDDILEAIGNTTNEADACRMNVEHSVRHIVSNPHIEHLIHDEGVHVLGAIYDIESGKVEFLD